ncbi:ALP1-like protein, partial [Tanacetum coccineum]
MSQINSECLFFDDTDDETEVNSLLSGFLIDAALVIQASTPTIQKYQRSYMPRDRYGAHDRLVLAYFAKKPFYNAYLFRKRFRMNRSLFTRIVRDLSANCPYFQEGCDAVGKAGISALVKCTSAIRQLAYAAVPDSLDEYLQIGEKTSRDCLMHFCNGVIELYGEEYLRRPTQTDVEKLYAFHENKHGFPGMIGSIDCTKWPWAQCPQAYRAQFSRGDSGSEPFILLEAVASQDLWIWHAFFGVAGSNNDVNVLRQSPVLNDLKVGKAPEVPFVANDVTYKWGYYLTDGIYPEWAVLMKSISQPGSNDVKRIRYKQAHEAARKDVERAFGVLKKKWAIVRTPARSRSLKRITHLMYTCIILHNMIRKEKGKAISPDFYPEEQHREDDPRIGRGPALVVGRGPCGHGLGSALGRSRSMRIIATEPFVVLDSFVAICSLYREFAACDYCFFFVSFNIIKSTSPNCESLPSQRLAIMRLCVTFLDLRPPWVRSVVRRDLLLSDDVVDLPLLEQLNENRTLIRKYPEDRVIAPSSETLRLVEHTFMDELTEAAGKKKRKVGFSVGPPLVKKARACGIVISEPNPTIAGKTLAALRKLKYECHDEYGSTQDGNVRTHPASDRFTEAEVVATGTVNETGPLSSPGMRLGLLPSLRMMDPRLMIFISLRPLILT